MTTTASRSHSTNADASLNGTQGSQPIDGRSPEEDEQGLSSEEALQLLRDAGAILDGHYQYESKRHGSIYVEKFRLLEHRPTVEILGGAIGRAFADLDVSLVVGPTTGGWLLAYATAGALANSPRVFCAEPAEAGGREFKRGFTFRENERVLVVDDVLTTGGSLRDTIAAVSEAGGEPVAVGVIVDRTNGAAAPNDRFEGLEFFSCLKIEAASYAKADCKQCTEGVELTIT